MTLEIVWYLVIILSLICYAVLDGFDLGVGTLHLFTKKDEDRRIFLNAIGPVWDGNEVWLVIVVGALFAGFPPVFGTILSTFYIPVMVFLMGLILRAVSIEFRSKRESKRWRGNWDRFFFLGSVIIAFGAGLLLGNLIHGFPLDEKGIFAGNITDFFHPYALLIACLSVALFAMHGSIFLLMKTEEPLHSKVRRWVPRCIGLFMFLYLVTTAVTMYTKPYMIAPMKENPWLLIIPMMGFILICAVLPLIRRKRDGWAFICSCLSIAFLLSLAAIGTYPYMIRSTLFPETRSLMIFNSASSPLTLKVLLIIVAIGVPLVLGYGFYIYRVFRGKVKLDFNSY